MQNTQKPGAVIFDLDGTLIDSAADIAAALNHVRAAKSLPALDVAAVVPMIGGGSESLLRQAFAADGMALGDDELHALHAMFTEFYTSPDAAGVYFPRSSPYAGVPALLHALRAQGVRVALCTNKAEAMTFALLKARDLSGLFDAVSAGRPGRAQKPDPAPLRDLLDGFGLQAASAVMVGDSEADIRCARAAGMPSIGVTFGYTRTPMAALGANAVIDDFTAFGAALDAVFG